MKATWFVFVGVLMAANASGASLTLHDYETAVLEPGDEYQDVYLFENSSLTMLGGHVRDRLYFHDYSHGDVYGESARVLCLYHHATAQVYGGSYEQIENIGGETMLIDGAKCEVLSTGAAGKADIYKIEIEDYLQPGDRITLYGREFDMDPLGGTYGQGIVTGLWGDYTPFSITLRNTGTGAAVDLIQMIVIPEPATLALLALGGLAVLRRRPTKGAKR